MALPLLLCFLTLETSSSNEVTITDDDKIVTPTLFSIKDPLSGEFINALANPLYDDLQSATFSEDKNELFETSSYLDSNLPTNNIISVDKQEVKFGEKLELSWNDDHPLISDNDVLTFHCPATSTSSHKSFLEAFTIGQAKLQHLAGFKDTTPNTPTRTQLRRLRRYETLRNSTSNQVVMTSRRRFEISFFPVLRHDECHFRLWKRHAFNGTQHRQHLTLLSRTPPIALKDGTVAPTGIHLSVTTDPSQMRVHFTTGKYGHPFVDVVSIREPWKHVTSTAGTTTTYSASDMCQSPANETGAGKFVSPGYLHTVTLKGLDFDTTYNYRVGITFDDDDNSANNASARFTSKVHYSDIFNLTTAPAPNTTTPYSLIIYGDQGAPGVGWEGGFNLTTNFTTREVVDAGARSVHILGDLSYAHGAAHVWDSWMSMIQPFAVHVPVMAVVGNYEYDHSEGGDGGKDPSGVTTPAGYYVGDSSGGECGVPIAKRFMGSGNGNGVFWYSYDYGLLHVVVISSEHDLAKGSVQYDWMEGDLNGVDRTVTPWLIVETHRPLYFPSGHQRKQAPGVEHLLMKYGVDLFLTGHVHRYVRSCSGFFNASCNNEGSPTQIIVGTGGKILSNTRGCHYSQIWMKSCWKMYGYGKLTVHNKTALHWEFVGVVDGNVKDEVWLYRNETSF